MCHIKLLLVVAIVVISANLSNAQEIRNKRTSDQRLAELETLISLAKMNKKLVTIPVGLGVVDPYKLGRRKRSVNILLQKLIKDLSLTDDESGSHETLKNRIRSEEGGEDFQT